MTVAIVDAFLRRRRSLMGSIMRIVRDPHTAEDLAQETYLRASRAAQHGPIDHVEAFLHQTARNLALDHLRRNRSKSRVEVHGDGEGLESVPADIPSIEAALLERERFRAFSEALAVLPARARAVVILSRIEKWSNIRIAGHLGVSERTVFNDLKLAMAHCRDALARLDRG